MANYAQWYIPGLATMVKSLRELTKQDVDFVWTPQCESAWMELKNSLTSSSVMSYYDPSLKTELVVDGSPFGLGAMLTQVHDEDGNRETRVVAYASKALDDVESRYSQIEREALAVRWGYRTLPPVPVRYTVLSDHRSQTARTCLCKCLSQAVSMYRKMVFETTAVYIQGCVQTRCEQSSRLYVSTSSFAILWTR